MTRRVLAVAGRELRGYFDHATAYILLVVFLAVSFFFFFREAYLIGQGTLRPMFGLMPWLLLFFVPAVTMRTLAEERRVGTLELVLSQPIGEAEFLLGKFLGVMGFLAVALAGTLGVPLGLAVGTDLQWGVVFAQYAGTLLLLCGLVAIGLWASSLTGNQVTAFIVGVAVTFTFYLLGLQVVLLGLPPALAGVADRLGILGHYENIGRGVIDLRDAVYFVSLTAAFLALSYHSLLRRKLSPHRAEHRRLSVGTAALLALAVLASLLGAELRGRLDLTPGKVFTLSPNTRQIVGGLDDLVTVRFYRSRELPPEVNPVRRDIEDILRDFDAAGGANLQVVAQDPGRDPEAREEASRHGVHPITFNVLGEDQVQVREGYLGVAVSYAGQSETIPVLQRTADLEYRLTAAIRGLTAESRPVVAFLEGHGESGPFVRLREVGATLRESYGVETLRIDTVLAGISDSPAAADSVAAAAIPDSVDVLVIAGPTVPIPEEEGAALHAFAERGGSLLMLLSSARVDRQTRFAVPQRQPVLDTLLARYRVRLADSLAVDVRLHARLPVTASGGFQYLLPYPLWPLARAGAPHVIVDGVGTLTLPWTTPLTFEDEEAENVVPLLVTSEFGGAVAVPTSIDAERDWSDVGQEEDLGPRVLAVAATAARGDGGSGPSRGRIVVVGNAEFVTDEFLGISPNNLLLVQNAVDWLAQDEALIAIRSKDRTPPPLLFRSELTRDAVKYGNLVGVPLLFVLFGILRLARRRRLRNRRFGEERAAA